MRNQVLVQSDRMKGSFPNLTVLTVFVRRRERDLRLVLPNIGIEDSGEFMLFEITNDVDILQHRVFGGWQTRHGVEKYDKMNSDLLLWYNKPATLIKYVFYEWAENDREYWAKIEVKFASRAFKLREGIRIECWQGYDRFIPCHPDESFYSRYDGMKELFEG